MHAASSTESNVNSSPEDEVARLDRTRFDDVDVRGLRFSNDIGDRRTRPRFGEPVPDREGDFPAVLRGTYAKIGAAPNGMIAEAGRLVMVDCVAFTGQSRISSQLTETYRQGGDIAVLAQPWKVGDTSVLVRRPSGTDSIHDFLGLLKRLSSELLACLNHISSQYLG